MMMNEGVDNNASFGINDDEQQSVDSSSNISSSASASASGSRGSFSKRVGSSAHMKSLSRSFRKTKSLSSSAAAAAPSTTSVATSVASSYMLTSVGEDEPSVFMGSSSIAETRTTVNNEDEASNAPSECITETSSLASLIINGPSLSALSSNINMHLNETTTQQDEDEDDDEVEECSTTTASTAPTIPSTLHTTLSNAALQNYKPKAKIPPSPNPASALQWNPSSLIKISSKIDIDDAVRHYHSMVALLGPKYYSNNNSSSSNYNNNKSSPSHEEEDSMAVIPIITCNPSTDSSSKDTVEPVNLRELKHVLEKESEEEISNLYNAIMKELNLSQDEMTTSGKVGGDGIGGGHRMVVDHEGVASSVLDASSVGSGNGGNGTKTNNRQHHTKKSASQQDKVECLLDCYASIAGGSTLPSTLGGGTTCSSGGSVVNNKLSASASMSASGEGEKEQNGSTVVEVVAAASSDGSVMFPPLVVVTEQQQQPQPSKPSLVFNRKASNSSSGAAGGGGKPPLHHNKNPSLFKQLFTKKKRYVAATNNNNKKSSASKNVAIKIDTATTNNNNKQTETGDEVQAIEISIDNTFTSLVNQDDDNNKGGEDDNKSVASSVVVVASSALSVATSFTNNNNNNSSKLSTLTTKNNSSSSNNDNNTIDGVSSLQANLPWVTSSMTGMTHQTTTSLTAGKGFKEGFEVIRDDVHGKDKILASKNQGDKKNQTNKKKANKKETNSTLKKIEDDDSLFERSSKNGKKKKKTIVLDDGDMVPKEAFISAPKKKKLFEEKKKKKIRASVDGHRRGRSRSHPPPGAAARGERSRGGSMAVRIRSRSRAAKDKKKTATSAAAAAKKKEQLQQQAEEEDETGSLWEDASRNSKPSKLLLEDGAMIPKEALKPKSMSKRIKNMSRSRSLVINNVEGAKNDHIGDNNTNKSKAEDTKKNHATSRRNGRSGFKSPIRLRSLSRGRSSSRRAAAEDRKLLHSSRVEIETKGNLEGSEAVEVVEKRNQSTKKLILKDGARVPSFRKKSKYGGGGGGGGGVRFTVSPMRFRSRSRGLSKTREKNNKCKNNDKAGRGNKKEYWEKSRRSRPSSRSSSKGSSGNASRGRGKEKRGLDPDGIVASERDLNAMSKTATTATTKTTKSKSASNSTERPVGNAATTSTTSKSKKKSLRGWDDDNCSDDDVSFVEHELFALPDQLVSKGANWFNWNNNAGSKSFEMMQTEAKYEDEDDGATEEEEVEEQEEEQTDTGGTWSFETMGVDTEREEVDDDEATDEEQEQEGATGQNNTGWFNWTAVVGPSNDDDDDATDENAVASSTFDDTIGDDGTEREDDDDREASGEGQQTLDNNGWFSPLTNYFADSDLGDLGLMTETEDERDDVEARTSRRGGKSRKSRRRSASRSKGRRRSRGASGSKSKSARHVKSNRSSDGRDAVLAMDDPLIMAF